jgi:hypothetical protein
MYCQLVSKWPLEKIVPSGTSTLRNVTDIVCPLVSSFAGAQISPRLITGWMGASHVFLFQRNYVIHWNGYGRVLWTFSLASQGGDPLNVFQEYINPISSDDLYVISVYHNSLLWPCIFRHVLVVLFYAVSLCMNQLSIF